MKITLRKDSYSLCQFIEWPTLKISEKKAYLVQTPAGEIWFSSSQVDYLIQIKVKRQRDELINLLRESTSSSANALVPVKRAGKGSSEKSGKFKVEVWRNQHQNFGRHDELVTVKVERTFTLPVSQVTEKEGQIYLPLWIFKKHLRREEKVVGTLPNFEKIVDQIDEVFARNITIIPAKPVNCPRLNCNNR